MNCYAKNINYRLAVQMASLLPRNSRHRVCFCSNARRHRTSPHRLNQNYNSHWEAVIHLVTYFNELDQVVALQLASDIVFIFALSSTYPPRPARQFHYKTATVDGFVVAVVWRLAFFGSSDAQTCVRFCKSGALPTAHSMGGGIFK